MVSRDTSGQQAQKRSEKFVCRGSIKKVCGINIKDDQNSILCDACELWFHPKCQGLSGKAFEAIAEYQLLWLCDSCKEKLQETLSIRKQIEQKLALVDKDLRMEQETLDRKLGTKIEEGLKHIEETVNKKIDSHMKAVEETLKSQEQIMESSAKVQAEEKRSYADMAKEIKDIPKYTEKLRESADNLFTNFMEHKQDKERRENNLILHNVTESLEEDPKLRKSHDSAQFGEVISALLGDIDRPTIEIEKIYRLGKKKDKDEKPRLLLVRLKSKEHVNMLLKKRKMLRQNAPGLGPVFLTADLTPDERKREHELKQELEEKGKETHRVFRGKVVRK